MFKIILSSFQAKKKLKKARLFQETFLLAKINMELILKMYFLTFNNTDILFIEQNFT